MPTEVKNAWRIGSPGVEGWTRTARPDDPNKYFMVSADCHVTESLEFLATITLNVHGPGSLYEAFDPARARRIAEKLEWHYTPRHGSWLNVAECELAALSAQCLDRRIGSIGRLRQVVAAWEGERNERQVGVDWRFTTADARIKLKRPYPAPRMC